MNEDEKKVQEELEETTETAVEETVGTTEEAVEVEQEEQAPVEEAPAQEKEEAPQDSEKYYDDINYQQKEVTEEVKAKTRGILREVLDWVICFAIAFVVYLLINYFFICAPTVKQQSMHPTIKNNEKVLTIRPWMKGSKFEYGQIITFEAPIDNKLYIDSNETLYTAQYENYTGITLFLYNFLDVNKVSYIKRVIGLPGDHIVIKDGMVYRNDEKIEEPYLREMNTEIQEQEYADVIVPENTIYVMGDNREQSKDSRSFGCIPYSRVNGYVLCRIWPLNKLGSIE
ncbi:MAG: signal peptidase I [Clostridia bacterium]|nr:signal peptidase I [Clostridia bacterium]